jgi:hypothetical protein
MAIKLMFVEITTSNSNITLNSNVIKPWWSAFFAITAVQNVLTTSLLVWRIWRVEHQNVMFRGRASFTPTHQPRLSKVIRVVAESGLAYSTLVFMTFIVSVCNSNALYPLSDATLQATGITFNVIIIRSTPRRDEQFTDFDTTQRGTVTTAQTEGPASRRGVSGLQFINHGASTQSKTLDKIEGIDITVKSTTDRLEDGDWQPDTYSMKKVGAV